MKLSKLYNTNHHLNSFTTKCDLYFASQNKRITRNESYLKSSHFVSDIGYVEYPIANQYHQITMAT